MGKNIKGSQGKFLTYIFSLLPFFNTLSGKESFHDPGPVPFIKPPQAGFPSQFESLLEFIITQPSVNGWEIMRLAAGPILVHHIDIGINGQFPGQKQQYFPGLVQAAGHNKMPDQKPSYCHSF